MVEHFDYDLSAHNTFGIPARCERFVEYATVEELRAVLAQLRSAGSRFLHIGSGSNLLFLRDFAGTILHSALTDITIVSEDAASVCVRVGAGVVWDDFVAHALVHGWYGAENLSLIPGEVGASAVQNIGAYGTEVEELITSVETLAVADGTVRIFSHDDCDYDYRHSIFKTALKGQYVVTAVVYRLQKTFTPNYRYAALRNEVERRGLLDKATADTLRQIVIEVRQSKLPDPKEQGNAGSFFMNPIVSQAVYERLLAQCPAMPSFPTPQGVKIPAGWLIEQSGWKGKALGAAAVHDKQALVLVNKGGATGADILRLCEAVQTSVEEKFGIRLHPEVNFIDS